jgi:hypothetical protein
MGQSGQEEGKKVLMLAGVRAGIESFNMEFESKTFIMISASGCPSAQCQKFTASGIF